MPEPGAAASTDPAAPPVPGAPIPAPAPAAGDLVGAGAGSGTKSLVGPISEAEMVSPHRHTPDPWSGHGLCVCGGGSDDPLHDPAGLADLVDVEGKARKAPAIGRGSYVKWPGGQGRVDLVVTDGKVPGVDSDVTGSAADPALRIVVYVEADGQWKAGGDKVARRASSVARTAPLANRRAPQGKSAATFDTLADLLADQQTRGRMQGWPDHALPDGGAVKAVYERGTKAWPGEARTTLTAERWAVERVKAFLATAAGDRPAGYSRDDDLLPATHPEYKGAPVPRPGRTRPTETVTLDPDEVKDALRGLRRDPGGG